MPLSSHQPVKASPTTGMFSQVTIDKNLPDLVLLPCASLWSTFVQDGAFPAVDNESLKTSPYRLLSQTIHSPICISSD